MELSFRLNTCRWKGHRLFSHNNILYSQSRSRSRSILLRSMLLRSIGPRSGRGLSRPCDVSGIARGPERQSPIVRSGSYSLHNTHNISIPNISLIYICRTLKKLFVKLGEKTRKQSS